MTDKTEYKKSKARLKMGVEFNVEHIAMRLKEECMKQEGVSCQGCRWFDKDSDIGCVWRCQDDMPPCDWEV